MNKINNTLLYPLFNRDLVIYPWKENILRVGSDDDSTKEIIGHPNIWKKIIKQFDGQRTVDELANDLSHEFSIEKNQVLKFIQGFASENFINFFPFPYDKNDPFLSYFNNAITYYSSAGLGGYKLLQQLQKMKICILGCGGGGSHLAYYFAQMGVGYIHIVDPDRVERKNVSRQALFEVNDIGKLKVTCFKKALLNKNPYVQITTSTSRMRTIADVKHEIKDVDWVVCAMDEPPYIAQRLVNRACYEIKLPSLYCFSQKTAGKLIFVDPRIKDCACIDCLLAQTDSEEFQDLVQFFVSGFKELETATIMPNFTLLCSWIVKKWLNLITKQNNDIFNKLFRFDFDRFEEKEFHNFSKHPDCPTCQKTNKIESNLWKFIPIQ